MIFNGERNLLEVVEAFLEFFCEESCGYCAPCRVGNVLLKTRVARSSRATVQARTWITCSRWRRR
jgi:NADH:ubiquinone oxidoreductase subunit F (NADH-binding)